MNQIYLMKLRIEEPRDDQVRGPPMDNGVRTCIVNNESEIK